MTKGRELNSHKRSEIIILRQEKYSYSEISKKLKISPSTAFNIYKSFKETGNISKKKRIGRPSLLNEKIKKKIINLIRKNPRITSHEIEKSLRSKVAPSPTSI